MKRTATFIAILAGFASVGAGLGPVRPLVAAPVVTGKSSTVLEKRMAMPPPDVVERLKKVGLDPKDPNFAARLKALAAQTGPAYVRSHVVSNTPTADRKPNAGRTSVAKAAVSSKPPRIAVLAPVKGVIPLPPALSSPLPDIVVFTEKKIYDSGLGSVSVALGCAGVTFTRSASVSYIGGDPIPGSLVPSFGYEYSVTPGDVPPFAIGQQRRGTISISFDNVSASADANFLPTEATVTIDVTIDHTPTATGFGSVSPWGSTGLTAGSATLRDPGTPRVGSGDWSTIVQGNDTVGDGVQLGPGWKVTSATVKSALSASAPQDTSPDNSWRGAKVTLQPQAGTLRTGVAWHYSGVDTLDYTVEWILTGPLGQRPLLTMAKHDACDN